MEYTEIIEMLENPCVFDDDADNEVLEKAMNWYCGMHDVRQGMKHALILTLRDQYENHPEEQEEGDLDKLSDILNRAI